MTIESTVWRPTDGNGEYSSITPVDIVDPLTDEAINDPLDTSILLTSTDTQFIPKAQTIWSEDE